MASYMSDAGLNIAADAISAATVTVRPHTGAPGDSGTSNQVGSVTTDVAAAGWTPAAAGVSQTTAQTSFGVLSAGSIKSVSHYSLWKGATFLGWADLVATIRVPAGESFVLNAGTVRFRFARP